MQKDEKSRLLDQCLSGLYYNIEIGGSGPSVALSRNISKLAKAARSKALEYEGLTKKYITESRVRAWLRKQKDSQKFKPRRHRFKRTQFYSPAPNHCWLADSGVLKHLQTKKSDPPNFILVLDLFSRKLYGRLLPSLKSEASALAFEEILTESGTKPVNLGCDNGTEYAGSPFQDMLRRNNIHFYTSSDPDTKISPVERCMKTIKELLHRSMVADKQDRSYADLFRVVLWIYNHRKHSALPKEVPYPAMVDASNAELVHEHLYGRPRRRMIAAGLAKFKLNIGDRVLVQRRGNVMDKGFKPGNWSSEHFEVAKRIATLPSTYKLRDHTGIVLRGRFYYAELQRLPEDYEAPEHPYQASRLVATRKQKGTGREQVLVVLDEKGGDRRNAYWLDRALVALPEQNITKARREPKQPTRPTAANKEPKHLTPPTTPTAAVSTRPKWLTRRPQKLDL